MKNSALTYFLSIGGIISFDPGLFNICNLCSTNVLAQIVPDSTLGMESSVVDPDVEIEGNLSDLIKGGAIRGKNLFHSFEKFNIGEEQAAYFYDYVGIEHIFSRVTGSDVSQILGKLGVVGNADLFLINPNGIIFGSNATLDLNGSFLATTADTLMFEDGTQFKATNTSASPLLTVSIPIGLQFGETPGNILNQSQAVLKDDEDNIFGLGLEVKPEKTLALVGGNVTMKGGSIFAPRAHIEIGSVDTGRVLIQEIDSGWALSYKGVQSFQDIELTQYPMSNNELLLEGISLLSTIGPDGRGGGSIQVQGKNITITNGSQINGSGADLTMSASETVKVSGTTTSGIFSAIASESPLTGKEGNVTINAKRVIVQDGGRILSETNGFKVGERLTTTRVPGGNLIINASESVELKGNNESLTGLLSRTRSFGAAGNITISTQQLVLSNEATISAESSGVDLDGNPIETGQAGNIKITASELLELNNGSITSESIGLGDDAGNVILETKTINIFNGSEVTVSHSQGRAGNLEINANSLFLNEGSITAETAQTGGEEGANINITSNLLTLQNESQISATARDLANGGNIDIDADFVVAFPSQNNDIIARASEGEGGNIDITTSGIFGIQQRSSTPVNNTNDIDPSSDFGLDGTVNINELEVNPAEGLENLPAEVIDVARLVETNLCQQGRGSEFVVTGKGGVAASPSEARDGDLSAVDLVEPVVEEAGEAALRLRSGQEEQPFGFAQGEGSSPSASLRARGAEEKIIEAQGWIVNDRGTLELVAYQTDTGNFLPQLQKQLCP